MPLASYRDLRVWQDAMALAESCYELTRCFPKDELFGLTSQIRRAAASVPANIAEGYGCYHYEDNRQFQFYARGSLEESWHWLRRARHRKLLSEPRHQDFKGKVSELAPQLNAYIRTRGRKAKHKWPKS